MEKRDRQGTVESATVADALRKNYLLSNSTFLGSKCSPSEVALCFMSAANPRTIQACCVCRDVESSVRRVIDCLGIIYVDSGAYHFNTNVV